MGFIGFIVLYVIAKGLLGIYFGWRLQARVEEIKFAKEGLCSKKPLDNRPVGFIEPVVMLILVVFKLLSLSSHFESPDAAIKQPKRKDVYIIFSVGILIYILCVGIRPETTLDSWITGYLIIEAVTATMSVMFVGKFFSKHTPISPERSIILLFILYGQIIIGFAIFYLRFVGSVVYSDCCNSLIGRMDSLYFSTVTMTTLGYGDFRPATDIGKGLIIIQTLVGIFLLVVILANFMRLIKTSSDKTTKKGGN